MTTAWKIARRAPACGLCGAPFADGEEHYSLLRLEEGLQRSDRCLGCFRSRPAAETEFFWRTKFVRDRRRRIAVDLEALREAFLALPPAGDRSELRYLIALLLLRKRALRLLETKKGEGDSPDVLVVAPKRPGDRGRGGEPIEIPVPPLSPERIDALREELRTLLGLDEGSSTTPDGEEPVSKVGETGGDSTRGRGGTDRTN